MKVKCEGIIVPMVTPFDKNQEIDEKALRQLVDVLIDSGVYGLFPLASLGEFYTLTEEEKYKVMSTVVDQANGRVPVFPGVGNTSLKAAKKLTEYAKDIGADGVVAVGPYYAPQGGESLYQYFAELAEVGLPILVYNIPQFTGYYIPTDVIIRLADEGLLVGMKDSSGNMMYFADLVEAVGDKISMLQGQDKALFPSLVIGAKGGIVGTPNIYPEYALGVYNSYIKGDLEKAREYHNKLVKLARVLSYGTFPAGFKYAGRLLGAPVGYPRKPTYLSDSDKEFIKSVLKELGLIK